MEHVVKHGREHEMHLGGERYKARWSEADTGEQRMACKGRMDRVSKVVLVIIQVSAP